jgi:lipopolysaccharide O-acetyltransferase
MKRDFSAESPFNWIWRAWRAAMGRLRGLVYRGVGLFAAETGGDLVFGAGPRFINTRAMRFGRSVHFGLHARLECFGGIGPDGEPRLSIRDGTSFGDYCHVGAANRVCIGRRVLGASNILILDHNHGTPKADLANVATSDPKARELVSRGEVIIGDDVWIGEGVIILAGSRIGDGAIIAAHAVVRGHVPERSIFYGE